MDLAGLSGGVINAARAEAEHRPTHALNRHVPREDDQIAPAQTNAILLLDGPEQAPRLVQVRVVLPRLKEDQPGNL